MKGLIKFIFIVSLILLSIFGLHYLIVDGGFTNMITKIKTDGFGKWFVDFFLPFINK